MPLTPPATPGTPPAGQPIVQPQSTGTPPAGQSTVQPQSTGTPPAGQPIAQPQSMGGTPAKVPAERDPVYLMSGIRTIITKIAEEVIAWIIFRLIEKPIDDKQKEIDKKKDAFPRKYINAQDKAQTKKEYEEDIRKIEREIIELKKLREKFELSFLYADMGVQTIFNGIMTAAGLIDGACDSSIKISGMGDILIKADKSKKLYVSKTEDIGTFTPAITTGIDAAVLGFKFVTKVSKWTRDGMELKNKWEDYD